MTEAATRRLYSPDDLLSMEDGDIYELEDGELCEVPVGAESQLVAFELVRRIDDFVKERRLGLILPPEVGLRIFPGRPLHLRRPDGGFVGRGKLPGDRMPKGFLTVAPDLVFEAVSPGDTASYMQRKIQEYLGAGVRLVWILFPDTRTAEVYRQNGTVVYIHPEGELDGEDVIPGFRCPLVSIMPQPEPPAGETGRAEP